RAACEASLRALDVPRVDAYLLHAPDPRTPIETSARALDELRKAGLARAIGVSNVSLGELEAAARVAEIRFVEVRLGPAFDAAARGGVLAWCAARGVEVLAHTPLGGAAGAKKLAKDARLAEVARRHGAEPIDVALATVIDAGATPLAGCTRVETAARLSRALSVAAALDDADREILADLAPRPRRAVELARAATGAEVVMIMGLPASGKTTRAKELEASGFARLNRDERGGALDAIAGELGRALAAGGARFVLDNTYLSRASRSRVIDVARANGAAPRCVFVDAPIELAEAQACARMIAMHGALPTPEHVAAMSRREAGWLLPSALFRARRALEPPRDDEGFASIERVVPVSGARPSWSGGGVDAAVVIEAGAFTSADVAGRARPHLAALAACGARMLGTAWRADVDALQALSRALGVDVAWRVCPHAAGPPTCWCRKPLPGLGVAMVLELGLDPARVVHVGRSPADRGFAARSGFRFVEPAALADVCVAPP
ncbi:MAG TPA: aldo/keto reductase, partial [Byssovorax sp.]